MTAVPSHSTSLESSSTVRRSLPLIGISLGALALSDFLAPGLLVVAVLALGMAGYLAWQRQPQSKTVACVALAVLVGIGPWWIIGVVEARGF